MSFVVKGSFGEIEVDCIINGLITPNKMIMFNAMLVDGRKIFVGIAPINKGYQEALEQIQEINKILEVANCKKEKAAPAHKPKYKWGDWKENCTFFINPFSCKKEFLVYKIRTNGKRVQVEFEGVKVMASCNIEAGDQFNYEFGRKLAERRLIAKLIEKFVNDTSKIGKTN